MSAIDERIYALLHEADEAGNKELNPAGLDEKLTLKEQAEPSMEQMDLNQPLVLVEGERIPFSRRELLERKISMILPKTFHVMNGEEAALKYPSEHRPSLIYTNETGSINLTFSWMNHPLTEEGLGVLTEEMSYMLRANLPIREWKGSGVREIVSGERIGYSQYISSGLNANLYNEMGFAVLEGKTLLCSFNCTEPEMKTWAPLFKSMMDSIQVISGGEDA